jgi:hypothetical protein
MHIASIGIDLGKTTFHLVALGDSGKIVVRKKFTRKQAPTLGAGSEVKPTAVSASAADSAVTARGVTSATMVSSASDDGNAVPQARHRCALSGAAVPHLGQFMSGYVSLSFRV